MKLRTTFLATMLLCAYQPVSANMNIAFVESAPKDWFSLTNSGECILEKISMTVDLSNTAGKLIFDTSSAGEGVEVFQPFETREGNVQLTSAETVLDGENRLSVFVDTLAPGQSVSFTIDVDDTLPKSELGNIRVSDSEMLGGMVSLNIGDQPDVTGTFDSQALISLPSPDCRITADI